ncbi:MAG: histidine kinase [Ancrocorticia sp.]
MPQSKPVSSRIQWFLHVLFGISIAAALGGAAMTFGRQLVPQAATGMMMVVITLGAWYYWSTGRQARTAALVFALSSVGSLMTIDTFGFPLVFTALIVLVLSWGLWAGVGMALFITGVMAALLHQNYGGEADGLTQVVGQSVANALLFALVLIVAALLRAIEAQRAELVAANAQLTAAMETSRDLVLAEERARAAAELHDGLGHQLTLISISLEYADRMREKKPELAWQEVATASETARQALADMRLWVRALHPARLDQLGEPGAFEAIAEVFRGTGLDVAVDISSTERLSSSHALFAYRLIQEGLTNVLRHAGASGVAFAVSRSKTGALRLTVGDNGSGTGDIQPGYGLRGLMERAEELGGSLQLVRPGRLGGLDLVAELPEVK